MIDTTPMVEWYEEKGTNCLKFTFGERLTEREADFAILKWKHLFRMNKDKCINLIWDCTRMKHYESGARQKWTNTLFELKPQIGSIWLISESTLIRMGASVMGMATSLQIKAVTSEAEVIP